MQEDWMRFIFEELPPVTCPPKIDPTFMLGLGQGDRSKCHGKTTPSNRSLANCGKQKCFSVRDKRRGKSVDHLISANKLLPLAERIRWDSHRSSAPFEGTGEREYPAEDAGCGSFFG
jgi:hypothetical protein